MSDLPFGFSPGGLGEGPNDPFRALFGATGAGDISGALHRLADLLSWSGGPVNWDLARSTALSASAAGDRDVTTAEAAQVAEAVRLADLWLDPLTTLPSGTTAAEAWTRARWIEATVPAWRELCDPVATRVVAAMSGAMPEELRGVAGPLIGLMGQIGGLIFGGQVGSAIGNLAREVVGSTDIGLPLGPAGRAALVPVNVDEFGSGLGVPADQVRLYLALREAAYHRLFAHVPWLRAHLFEAVEAFARGIRVDTGAIERAMSELDPTALDPESLQRVLAGGLFEPQTTEDQRAALARLETALALVEGWVDEVVHAAAVAPLPSAAALRETLRRRRASGGPAEQAFAALVGLELRPRRLREAAALWRAVLEARGIEGRDAVWSHPDLLPGPDDLDDPAAFAATPAAPAGSDPDLDAELRRLAEADPGPDDAPPPAGPSTG